MANDTLFRQRAPLIMRRLMSEFAIDATSAAAIVGNLGHESAGFKSLQEIKPLVPGSRGGYGYAQWTGPRRRQYEQYCADGHLDPASHEANVGFLVWELRNTEKTGIPAVKRAGTLREKVVAFELAFERASKDHKGYASRERWATIALQVYTPGSAQGAPDQAKVPAPLPVPPAVPQDKQDAKEAGGVAGFFAAVTAALYALWGNWAFRFVIYFLIVAALYWFIARPIIRRMWALDEVEADFLTRVRLALKGVKTTLFSWLLGIAGIALPALSYIEGIDFSFMLPDIFGVPAWAYQYAILAVIGWITNMLRKASNTPHGQTDLALAPTVDAPPLAPDLPAPTADEWVETVKAARRPKKKKAKRRKRVRA
jgi:hypothetical protein